MKKMTGGHAANRYLALCGLLASSVGGHWN